MPDATRPIRTPLVRVVRGSPTPHRRPDDPRRPRTPGRTGRAPVDGADRTNDDRPATGGPTGRSSPHTPASTRGPTYEPPVPRATPHVRARARFLRYRTTRTTRTTNPGPHGDKPRTVCPSLIDASIKRTYDHASGSGFAASGSCSTWNARSQGRKPGVGISGPRPGSKEKKQGVGRRYMPQHLRYHPNKSVILHRL